VRTGTPVLPYSRQTVGETEVAAVAEAVRAVLLTGGPRLAAFEEALADAVDARYAVAVASGTAALHVAYRAAGIGEGDTVLTSPITFVATANAARYCGALPRFADVDARGALDPAAVAQAVALHGTPTAVVPVHYAGHPLDVGAIAAAAPGALVIEDACHALGAIGPDGRPVGACTRSAMAVFSFHPVKSITTGEGGAIVTNDAVLAARCRRLRDHGLVREPAALEAPDGPWSYEQHELGWNYRLTELQATLGTVQLSRLEGFVALRERIAARYDALLARLPLVRPVSPAPGTRSARHLYPVRVPAAVRRHVFERLRAGGIGVQVHYIPVHHQPYYRRLLGVLPGELPASEAFYAEALSLPCFPTLDPGAVDAVVSALGEALVGEERHARHAG
jgi:UDP-4-amino-4,6-dideoxy-N-acetyl-beta-L-altrosamine transaminase